MSADADMPRTVLRTEAVGGALELILNRPERKNAVTGPLVNALRAALRETASAGEVRATSPHSTRLER